MRFSIKAKDENCKVQVINERQKDGVFYFDVEMEYDKPSVPKKFSVSWKIPNHNCFSIWKPNSANSGIRSVSPNWKKQWVDARLASWLPIIQAVSVDGTNSAIVALSDAATPTRVGMGATEQKAELETTVEFFTEPVDPIKNYKATVRFDTRAIPYYDGIYAVTDWWENECGYTSAYVPDSAKMPMNSLWYSYHQDLNPDEIVRQCEMSKALGMDTVLIDDGWQTNDVSLGYKYCGDWCLADKKIPDMKGLCDRLHSIGVKVILWYSVPYMGIGAKNYERFKDMMLSDPTKQGWAALDPRYKEVRDYLIGIYRDALINYGLDGFKLDFIDSFSLTPYTKPQDDRRDFDSLSAAVDCLMTEVKNTLIEINPEVMIEFRQSYVGPNIRKFGNMLRVGDCPNDSLKNRVGTIDLRLTSGKTAVHSDMVMWHTEEPVESAAMQLASVIYSVPQVSVRFDEISKEQYEMVKYYLSFWRENRDVLLDGKLTADAPDAFYSRACAQKDGKAIISLYSTNVVESDCQKIVAINICREKSLILKGFEGKAYKVVNCMGDEVSKGTVDSRLCEVYVPLCGMIYIGQ